MDALLIIFFGGMRWSKSERAFKGDVWYRRLSVKVLDAINIVDARDEKFC